MLAGVLSVILWKDEEREEKWEEGQRGYREGNQPRASRVQCGAVDGDEARQVGADLTADPGLVSGHAGVDAWKTIKTAALAKTHHATLDPPCGVFGHHRATRIPLHRWNTREVSRN